MKPTELWDLGRMAYGAARKKVLDSSVDEEVRLRRTQKNPGWDGLPYDQKEAWVAAVRHVLGVVRRRHAREARAASLNPHRPVEAAVRNEALAMLRRLRPLARKSSRAALSDVMRDGSWQAGDAAYGALMAAGFYKRTSCPAMARAVTRAIEAVRKSRVKP